MSLCDLETDHDEDSPSRSLLTQFLRSGGRTGPELISIYTDIACSQPLDVDDTLHLACERHQLDHALIEGILRDRPAALSTPRDRGWLPIHHAAMANSYDAVAFLLKRFPGGASIEQDDGFLPLHMAVYFEDVDCDVVEMILAAHPAAARHRSRDGRTALHIAMENPNVNYRLARLLLHAYPEAAQLATDTGLLPLHICAENKHCSVEVFSAVLEAFPDAAGERDAPPRHRLPLHYAVITAAASSGSAKTAFVDIVKQLIKYTPLNKPLGDYSGKNPLHLIFQLLALCPYQPVGLKSDGSSSDGEGSEDSRALTVMGETDHSTETSSVDSLPTGACAVSTLELILNLLLVACPALLCERCSAGRLPIVDYIDLGARPSAAVVEAVVRVNSHALMIRDHRGCTPLHILLKK